MSIDPLEDQDPSWRRKRILTRMGDYERFREDHPIEDRIYEFYDTNAQDDHEDAIQAPETRARANGLSLLQLWTTMGDLVLNKLLTSKATFHQFPSFPAEVRQQIWHFAIMDKLADVTPQVIRVRWAAENFYNMLYLSYRVPWAQEQIQAKRNVRHHLLTLFLKVCKESSKIAQLYHGIHLLFESSNLVPGKLYFRADIDTLAIKWISYEDRLQSGIENIVESTIHLVESLRVYIKFKETKPVHLNDLDLVFEAWKQGGEAAFQRPSMQKFVTFHPFTNLKKLQFMVDDREEEDANGLSRTPEHRSERFMEAMTRHFFKPAYVESSVLEVSFSTYNVARLDTLDF